MTSGLLRVALLLVVLLTLVGCEKPGPSPTPSPEPRIVSVAPSTTETLFALGVGDQVVGVTRFCDFPPEATKRERIGGLTDVDVEKVLSLRPTLVVGVDSQTSSSLQRTLAHSDVQTLFVPVETFDDVIGAIAAIGSAVGRPDEAEKIAAELESRRRERPSGPRPRVLVLFGREPWIGAGPGTFADEMIRIAGGQNVLADVDSDYPSLDAEKLASLAPDLVIDTSFEPKRAVAIPGDPPVARIDPALMRPGPRLGKALDTFEAHIGEVTR